MARFEGRSTQPGVAAREEAPYEGFVDDGKVQAGDRVLFSEVAAAHDANAHGLCILIVGLVQNNRTMVLRQFSHHSDRRCPVADGGADLC